MGGVRERWVINGIDEGGVKTWNDTDGEAGKGGVRSGGEPA